MQFDPADATSVKRALRAGGVVPKVNDFGVGLRCSTGQSQLGHVRPGTSFYRAPEVRQTHCVSPLSDVYAFGVIMWELMMGCSVFQPRCATAPRVCQLQKRSDC